MQPLAFLWFDMQMTQRYLREKTFAPALSPANSANLRAPIGASRGTGNGIVQKLLGRGASVVRAVRKPNRLSTSLVKASPRRLASLAVKALVEEAELTPKPALVDARGPGAQDLSLSLMRSSAQCLAPFFELMALISKGKAYYLIPGMLVRVTRADQGDGMSEILLGGITKPLWTYNRFLTARPIRDIYGIVETPDTAGLIDPGDAAVVGTALNERGARGAQ
jgi:ATP:dephospho-CoA triphosphoribosyl transferase